MVTKAQHAKATAAAEPAPGSDKNSGGLGLMGVDVAVAVMRRGLPVMVLDGPGDAALASAAEISLPDGVGLLTELSGCRPKLLSRLSRSSRDKERLGFNGPHLSHGHRSASQPFTLGTIGPNARTNDDPAVEAEPAPATGCGDAALALAKLAGLLPAVLCAPVAVAAADVTAWAAERHIPHVRAADVAAYRHRVADTLHLVAQARVPLGDAPETRLLAFRPGLGGPEHLVIVVGEPDPSGAPLARIHSACVTGDLLASLRCDCGDQLRGAIATMATSGGGVLVYLPQEGRGIGLVNKLRAYDIQDYGLDTVDANEELGFDADERVYSPAARMLKILGYDRIRLMTNNPEKIAVLAKHGIEVVERVPHAFAANEHNFEYLQTKARRSGHLLPVGSLA